MKKAFLILAAPLLLWACSPAADTETLEGDTEMVVEETAATNNGDVMTICDENGNRYATESDAAAAGLDPAQYGATYCSEYLEGQAELDPSWDQNGDGINDCNDDDSCDPSVDYTQPRT